jgi:hypothetical protein
VAGTGGGMYFDHDHLALDDRVEGDITDLQHLDQPVELLGHLLDVFGFHDQSQPADAGSLTVADGQALDVVAAPANQSSHTRQDTGPILNERDDRMLVHIDELSLSIYCW